MHLKRLCLGGTFSPIHEGHMSLLERAFSSAEHVCIGLTSDAMASRGRVRKVAPYQERETALRRLCDDLASTHHASYEVRMIDDPIGFALDPYLDSIAVSEETEAGARTINILRTRAGSAPLEVLVVPVLKDRLGVKVSSTAVQAKAVISGRGGDGA